MRVMCAIALAPWFCVAAEPREVPNQFIVFNRAPGQGMNQFAPHTLTNFGEVISRFPNQTNGHYRTGVSYIFSVFRTAPERTLEGLSNFLRAAEQTRTPILVQIDTEHWWEGRPDLWNWWDASKPGYNPTNRHNVEWTGWSPEHALKIAWRNWGAQLRVLPPPNLASPGYQEACRAEIRRLVPVVMGWHRQLPGELKHLLIGIKLGHETSIGVNAYHYPDGNKLVASPASQDPNRPLKADNVPARGMAQIGFAALTYSGIRTNGTPTGAELAMVCQQYLEMLCREATAAGVPRELLFAHGAGWKQGEAFYDVPVNRFACPAWSFYGHASDPRKDMGVQRNLARMDAPYWAATEWLLQGNLGEADWATALRNTLSDSRCRYVCVFNWESIRSNQPALRAITELVTSEAARESRN